MSTAPKLPFSKFAVFTSEPTPRRKNVVELRRDKFEELKAKKAIDRANAVLDRLEARAVAYKLQIAALQKRLNSTTGRIDRLEESILDKMSEAQLERVDGFQVQFVAHPCPLALEIENPSLIPDLYMRQPPIPAKAPDKAAIKAALSRDESIPGVRLIQRTSLVRR